MLQELRIHNLALIGALSLSWPDGASGLSVLTGETGAGKSIILQALGLLTGGRGAGTWVREGCEQAGIEAVFSAGAASGAVAGLLEEHGLEPEGDVILVRRLLSRDGRSRLFVNDRSVTAKVTAELGSLLVNIAGQHDQQQLLQARSHLDFLDSYGELFELRQRYAADYAACRQAEAALQALREREAGRERERDFLRLQLEEIRKIQPAAGEDEALIRERERLKSSEALLMHMNAALRHLGEAEDLLVAVKRQVEQAVALDAGLMPLAERAASAGFELEDLRTTVDRYLGQLPTDTSRLELIAARLADLKQLERKFGPTLADVLAFAGRAARELEILDNMDEEIRRAGQAADKACRQAEQSAETLSQARARAAEQMAARMERELASLNFARPLFQVAQHRADRLGPTGRDEVEFLFSANPGESPRPLAKIVSGGELSRMLLAMKCLLARRDAVETVIFDEVDSGIGGQAAEAVAEKIAELSSHHQVLCITHLPQIAARADWHFLVTKQVADGRTSTGITLLDEAARRAELARMLDGERAGAETHAYVRELLARKGRGSGA